MKRRRFDIFSMSFLDTICCAFGAIVLLYMILNASSSRVFQNDTADTRAEVDRLELEVLEGYEQLVALTNALRSTTSTETTAKGASARVLEELENSRQQLASYNQQTLSKREHINQLKADLKALEEGNRRLEAGARAPTSTGTRVVAVGGQGDRQYLTGLRLSGKRTLLLVDVSASMLDETVVNIIRMRNMSPATQRQSQKWRTLISTVEWLLAQLPASGQFQAYGFNTKASALIPETAGQWQAASNAEAIGKALRGLREAVPQGGTSLQDALAVIRAINPRPDSVVLITDGLPTQDSGGPGLRKNIDAAGRQRLFERAFAGYPREIPLNVILFPMEGDPSAAAAYWIAARNTRGSFLVPSKDWP